MSETAPSSSQDIPRVDNSIAPFVPITEPAPSLSLTNDNADIASNAHGNDDDSAPLAFVPERERTLSYSDDDYYSDTDGHDELEVPFAPNASTLRCTWPSRIGRYNENVTIPKGKTTKLPVERLFTRFDSSFVCDTFGENGKKWKALTHPEGTNYYRSDRTYGTGAVGTVWLTDSNVESGWTRIWIEQAIRELRNSAENHELVGTEVFLKQYEFDMDTWFYYIVDHRCRSIFWLHPCRCFRLTQALGGVDSGRRPSTAKIHLRLSFEAEYWHHVEYFPHHYAIPPKVIDELHGILAYDTISTLTSEPGESLYSFSPKKMNTFRNIINALTLNNLEPEEKNSFVTSSVARLMGRIVFERLSNFHGCHGARLGRRQRVRPPGDSGPTATVLMNILSLFLFFAPHIHFKSIEETWIDDAVLPDIWKAFVEKLIREWEALALYATVLLNANVALLVIPVVSGPPEDAGRNILKATAAAITSQISIITSVGSIITSLLLRRYHEPKEESGSFAAEYIKRKNPHRLALLYSLPFALLMWSMVAFVVAVMITCFHSLGNLQKVITGLGWVLIAILVVRVGFASLDDYFTGESKLGSYENPAAASDSENLGTRPARWQGIKSWLRRRNSRNYGQDAEMGLL